MNLRTLIDHYYGGSRRTFMEAVGCSEKSVYRWLSENAVVSGGQIYLSVRRGIAPPDLPAPDRREDFEAMMKREHPDADLTRVSGQYVDNRVKYVWQGWLLAQNLSTAEALGTTPLVGGNR
ncbi:hypothetical protein VPZ60_004337 [Salmonella enterica]|nr:hypothetical protein [Salmonella enterica]